MAVTSTRNIVDMKEKGHFGHENTRIDKYTLGDELPAQLAELDLRPRKMTQPAFSLRRVTKDDKEEIIRFLRRFFFQDEPMNLAVNLLETPNSRCEELEEYSASTLEQGLSLATVDEHGQIVGVILNGLARREDVDYSDKSSDCPNEKFRRILQVLGHLDREAKIWEKLPESCSRVVEIRIASTHSDWRGRGLMRVLCEETERLAKSIGAGALRMDTTSAFSAAAAERLKYKKAYSVLYADLPYAPQPETPHLEARVYIKELYGNARATRIFLVATRRARLKHDTLYSTRKHLLSSKIIDKFLYNLLIEAELWVKILFPHVVRRCSYLNLGIEFKTTMTEQTYSIQPVSERDVEAIMDLLRRTFYVDEPLNEAVDLYTGPGSCPDLDEYCTHSLLEGLSYKAQDRDGNIVGVIINGVCPLKEEDNGNDLYSQAQRCQNSKFQRILHILAQRETGARLWERFPEKQLVEVKVTATDPAWRRKGIMNKLLHETEKATEQRGFKLLRIDTSSAYSAMSAERLGFTCVYQKLYSEILMDGQPLIVPKPPHLYDRVFIKGI
ncbi:uncharacterized protein LOC128674472 [Plodia interpunctella]|uniref:uncharacterized protein LOC128674472 n=1 Tax=Plodia interpunctella TaxID=58824 RepID=UPI002367C3E7|nr:uncharacterized protein LOC128674472 [Plodia interpunctella]